MKTSIVIYEDCLRGMRYFPDKYFDLAITDPPYGINVAEMAYTRALKNKNTAYSQKSWDEKPPSQTYYNELCRVSKEQIVFGIDYMEWQGVGPGRIKWNKGVPECLSFKRHEMLYCSMINETIELPLLWSGMMQAKSLSEPMTLQGNTKKREKRIHPTQKPRLLYKRLLLDYARKGQRIIDTHVGSGILRIEALEYGCNIIGFENDWEYWQRQEKRFHGHILQLKLF